MDLKNICLETCGPRQILNINNEAFNEISNIKIFNDCNELYNNADLEYSYSIDNNCWSCFMKYDIFITNIVDLKQDFYLRIRIAGVIGRVLINDKEWTDYSTQLDSSFDFVDNTPSQYNYNPYINMDCGIALYQRLTEITSDMVGIPCYYFKLSPNTNSKDLTFKEYALMNVSSVKNIKIIINDNQMPSSKPEFNDFGLDWQNDWEVEVSKATFATAFGNNIFPTSGDLIYIPMMKRMWMVNEAYEEKKDAFMWNATTIKLMLVKYQEKSSVDLGDTEYLVNSFVKNKYEDLFGDEENLDAQFDTANNESLPTNKLYDIYTSDNIRKSVNIENVVINENNLYYKGTLIADHIYNFNIVNKNDIMIEYQYKYCGDSGAISFIINPNANKLFGSYESKLLSIGNLIIKIKQTSTSTTLTCSNCNSSISLNNGKTYLIFLRWDKSLNFCDFGASEYVNVKNIPLYKLQPAHYRFEMDNLHKHNIMKYNIEMTVNNKSPLYIYSFFGGISNIKLFDIYNDNLSELMQMYPTHHHLIINDTARILLNNRNGSPI